VIPEGPVLWHLNRSTGLVLLVLLTLTVVLGTLSTRGEAGSRLPRFAVQALHRNLALLTAVLLALHVATAVLDEFVDIRWWQAFLPWELRYEPLWLALGILALDLLVAVVVTSVVRARMDHQSWWWVHLAAYPVWALSVVHGLLLGTDSEAGWVRATYAGCGLLVVLAVLVRVAGRRPSEADTRTRATAATWGGAR
jgi:methionine sulfoxide reductase heme-binding subunit